MKVVLVGAGSWGKNHARVLSQLGVLCAVCDTDKKRSAEFGKTYSVNHYTSVDELISSEEFDAAVVATPTTTHFEIAAILLGAKKHILVEKPITYKSKEGQQLVKLADRNKVVLTCGYIERFNPAVSIAKSHISEKKCGDLIILEFHRESEMPPRVRDVGVIYDTAVHDIDAANWLFDEMPAVVFARTGSTSDGYEDFASIMLGYRNHKTAVISANWIAPKKKRTLSAVCTDAIITSDFVSQEVKIDSRTGTKTPRNEKQEPLRLEIENFLGAVAGSIDLVVKPQQAVNVTSIAEAALLSSQKGVPIYLELK